MNLELAPSAVDLKVEELAEPEILALASHMDTLTGRCLGFGGNGGGSLCWCE